MAKEINLKKTNEKFTSQHDNILYRDHLEYSGSKLFWNSALILGAISIYAVLAFSVVQQLRK